MTTKQSLTYCILTIILSGCASTQHIPVEISRQAPEMPTLPIYSITTNSTPQEVAKKYYTTYIIQKEYIKELIKLLNV
jgi:PBP1b-binding outer membrane lipoprotein LpoB